MEPVLFAPRSNAARGHVPLSRGEAPLVALALALALAGCAPVGPNFVQPAAIVSPQFKEIAGWKIATPRPSEPKGEWWTVFRDPHLDRLEPAVAVSNQTVIADEANYREALALINEARAGLFPTINGNASILHSSPETRHSSARTTLTAEGTGLWTLDVWGQVRREIEAQAAGAEASAANLANALLAAQSTLALAYVTLREANSPKISMREPSTTTSARSRSRRTSTPPARRPSPTSSPRRRRCSTPRRNISRPASRGPRASTQSPC